MDNTWLNECVDETREEICKPFAFHLNGVTYEAATTGRFLVMVPGKAKGLGAPPPPAAPLVHAAMEAVGVSVDYPRFREWVTACPRCHGEPTVQCGSCDGTDSDGYSARIGWIGKALFDLGYLTTALRHLNALTVNVAIVPANGYRMLVVRSPYWLVILMERLAEKKDKRAPYWALGAE